jgi:hydrogenase 3 maturation protease
VLGVGSDLRGDDVAGVLVARRLAAWLSSTPRPRLRRGMALAAFDGGAAPENVTGEIRRFAPDLLVLVDAAFLERPVGAVEVVAPERIGGLTFSTHMLPASFVLDYLAAATGCRSVVLGIQIAQKDVLTAPVPAVRTAVRRLVKALQAAVTPAPRARPSARPPSHRG